MSWVPGAAIEALVSIHRINDIMSIFLATLKTNILAGVLAYGFMVEFCFCPTLSAVRLMLDRI